MTAKEREYVAVMSVGSPGVVLWHITCPKFSGALPEAGSLDVTEEIPVLGLASSRTLLCVPKPSE